MLSGRSWLTLAEGASFISSKVKKDVNIADVARLIADGELRPSIYASSLVFTKKVVIRDISLSETLSHTDAAISVNRPLLKKEPLIGGTILPFAEPVSEDIIHTRGVWTIKPIGAAKVEAESIYSGEYQLPKPERSLYDIKGIIITDGDNDYQIQMMINPEDELLDLISSSQVNGGSNSGFIQWHINNFKKIQDDQLAGNFNSSLVPCVGFPNNAYFVIQTADINDFLQRINQQPQKQLSAKTTNLQAELIHALISIKYGSEIANNPRPHIDNANGVIRRDLEKNGFTAPSGNAVSGWMRPVNR